MSWCSHPNLQSTARTDYCPDCKYEFYYGDAHASGSAQQSRIVNSGQDDPSHGVNDSLPEHNDYEDERY